MIARLGTEGRRAKGFTLVELLVVIAIIAILIALLLPAVQKVRAAADRARSNSNLHNLAVAANNFHSNYNKLPFNGTVDGTVSGVVYKQWGNKTGTSGSWAYQMLPFIEAKAHYDAGAGAAPSGTAASTPVPVLTCPGRGRVGYISSGPISDYGINPWLNEPNAGNVNKVDQKCTLTKITNGDGTSNTVFCGHIYLKTDDYSATAPDGSPGTYIESFFCGGTQATARSNPGAKDVTDKLQKDNTAPNTGNLWGGPFDGAALFAMCDGSVRGIPYGFAQFWEALKYNDNFTINWPD